VFRVSADGAWHIRQGNGDNPCSSDFSWDSRGAAHKERMVLERKSI